MKLEWLLCSCNSKFPQFSAETVHHVSLETYMYDTSRIRKFIISRKHELTPVSNRANPVLDGNASINAVGHVLKLFLRHFFPALPKLFLE